MDQSHVAPETEFRAALAPTALAADITLPLSDDDRVAKDGSRRPLG